MTGAVLAFTLLLAAANGSNDDPKGVATLGGAGVTGYRNALAWGVVTTLAGSVVSIHVAAGLTKLFSTGIVTAHPTPAFAISVLVGATGWVALATVTHLPVSTTRAGGQPRGRRARARSRHHRLGLTGDQGSPSRSGSAS